MNEDPPPLSPSSTLSTPHRRDRQRRPSSPLLVDKPTNSLAAVMVTESDSQRGRRRSSIQPHLASLYIISPSLSNSSIRMTDSSMSEDSGSDRGLKRRRRSSGVERCDEMRRMPSKRCNGGSISQPGGGYDDIIAVADGDHQRSDQQHRQHQEPSHHAKDAVSHELLTPPGSILWSSTSSNSTASASTSSLVNDMHDTSLSTSKSDSASSSVQHQPQARPQAQPQQQQQPVFTCPFTPYVKDRQDQQLRMAHGSDSSSHEHNRGDRRNSSISSQHTRRDSGWSTTDSRRGTITSGISSPSTSTTAVDMATNKQEWKPFPIDRLPRDIVNLILDHVLGSPEFGQNGRWKDKRGQEEDKVQMVRALKVSAAIHLKFALIHRSWTPHVIKSLYRFPRLTSKEAIEKFSRAIKNPLSLWGCEIMEDGQIGGAIGDRGRFVRLITYCVGRGRHSATDYLMWSGTWFAIAAGAVLANLPNTRGWECEGWCSKGCEETRELEVFNHPEEDRVVLRHLSILRSPLPADVLVLTLAQTKGMRALELLEVQKHFVMGDNLDLLKRGLRMANNLEIFAMKVEGDVELEGPMDDALSVMPTLRHLSVQADLLSMKFFATARTSNLQSILIGLATRPPILFHGKKALDTLWAEAQTEAIYSRVRQQAQNVFAEGTTFQGSVTHRMTLNSTTVSINGESPAGIRSSPASSMMFHQPLLSSSSSAPSEPPLGSPSMGNSPSSSQPNVGLESWLVRELNNSHSALSRVSLAGDDALAVYTSYTHQTPI